TKLGNKDTTPHEVVQCDGPSARTETRAECHLCTELRDAGHDAAQWSANMDMVI
ncbi:hypothetical protein HAX54_045212, partial [Datura stramonium]|nr:hypothetical protein [Datura stramonium]